MVHTASPNKSLTYAISYGLGGGPAHARQFSRLLSTKGFTQAEQIAAADIIIAHSGGCWFIPSEAKPKLVVYVGLPLALDNPRRTSLAAKAEMLKRSSVSWSAKTILKNAYYTLRRPGYNWRMVRMAKKAQPVVLPGAAAVFIINHYDPWPRSKQLKNYTDSRNWAFISMPGVHDDIWEHPDRYAAIIEHYARLLA